MRLRKDIPDALLMGAGVYDLDPSLPILACQAAALLGRSKTRMDSDRRDGKPPPYYKDGAKVLYPLGGVLEARAAVQRISPEQAAKQSRDAKIGWTTFQSLVAAGPQGAGTWPMLRVDGFPLDVFATLTMGLDPDRVDPEGVEDLTLAQIREERASFYQNKQAGWGLPPTLLGKEWGERLLHLTSKAEIFGLAYENAIKIYQAKSQEGALMDRRSATATARKLKEEEDHDLLRKVLNEAPDDFYMTRAMAQFFLDLSPKQFSPALKRGPHPFGHAKAGGGGRSGATKGQVLAWAKKYVEPYRKPARGGATSQRTYLVDDTGTVLADSQGSDMKPQDVAYAASVGADLLTMTLEEALAYPWRSAEERRAWGDARLAVLNQRVEVAHAAAAAAHAQEMELRFPPAAPRKKPTVRP